MVSVEEPGPEIDLPSKAPSGPFISPGNKRYFCCLHKIGGIVPVDFLPRVYSPKVGNMTVSVFRIVDVVHPLLKLTEPANLVRGNILKLLLQSIGKLFIAAQYFRSLNTCFKQAFYYLMIHRGAGYQTSVFG